MGHARRAGRLRQERAQAGPGRRGGPARGTAMSARPAAKHRTCAASEVPVPVLMYHSIATGSTRKFRRFVVDPAEFAAQMEYLDAAGYRPVTAAELAGGRSGGPLPPRPVVLTFDDAYTDFYSAALPVLREHGFRATLYVPTAYVGATTRFNVSLGEQNRAVLSWQALRRHRRRGHRGGGAQPYASSAGSRAGRGHQRRGPSLPGPAGGRARSSRSTGSPTRSATGTARRAPPSPPPGTATPSRSPS